MISIVKILWIKQHPMFLTVKEVGMSLVGMSLASMSLLIMVLCFSPLLILIQLLISVAK